MPDPQCGTVATDAEAIRHWPDYCGEHWGFVVFSHSGRLGTSALSTLGFGVEPSPPGRAKLLLSRELGDTPTRSRGSAGASPQCCEHVLDSRKGRSRRRDQRGMAAKNSRNAKVRASPIFAFFEFLAAIHFSKLTSSLWNFARSTVGWRVNPRCVRPPRRNHHHVHSTGLALPREEYPKIKT